MSKVQRNASTFVPINKATKKQNILAKIQKKLDRIIRRGYIYIQLVTILANLRRKVRVTGECSFSSVANYFPRLNASSSFPESFFLTIQKD